MEEECEYCGGSGIIETQAENRGGDIMGPDFYSCPVCQRPHDEDEDEEFYD